MKNFRTEIKDVEFTDAELAAIEKQKETTRWLCTMSTRTIRKYAGKWVAARGKRVIACAKTFAELADKLDRSQLDVTVIQLVEKPGTAIYHGLR